MAPFNRPHMNSHVSIFYCYRGESRIYETGIQMRCEARRRRRGDQDAKYVKYCHQLGIVLSLQATDTIYLLSVSTRMVMKKFFSITGCWEKKTATFAEVWASFPGHSFVVQCKWNRGLNVYVLLPWITSRWLLSARNDVEHKERMVGACWS